MNKATFIPATSSLPRDEYGALNLGLVLSSDQQIQVSQFLKDAVKDGLLPAPFVTYGKKDFECMNLDVYDVLVFRGQVKSLVVQARSFWKHLRKGHTRGRKDYYLVTRASRKTSVVDVEKSTCAKRAKNTTKLGQLVNHYLGKTMVACKKGKTTLACKQAHVAISTAYKVLAKTDDGRLMSAYDASEYKIGIWRSEEAKPGHGGGFYYYLNEALAIDATRLGTTFSASVAAGKELVLCEVEIKGREIEYGDGKWAASHLRVVSELEPVTIG